MKHEQIRNVAIIAHVDHGKTTLVDKLLHQSGTLDQRKEYGERVMDSNELERERGITILAKTTGIMYKDYAINVVDTPGHADFGGEVERVLTMVDSVLLLVDAVDGPMPQTRFVTQKAFACGLNPIVVINKIDRPGADPDKVMDQVFELFDSLGATDKQLDFPVIYTSALQGWAVLNLNDSHSPMTLLLDFIIDHVRPPSVQPDAVFKMQVTTLDYSPYVGTLGIGRVQSGKVVRNQVVALVTPDGQKTQTKISGIYRALGLERVEIPEGSAGDIIAITGSNDLKVSMTVCDPSDITPFPALKIDEPTVSMVLQVNDSPFVGKEGKLLTTRQIRERLEHEAKINVALKLEEGETADKFVLKGRGELHLAILLETMRREGFEMAVGRPQVILKKIDDKTYEPFELLIIDVPLTLQGTVLEELGRRKAIVNDMENIQQDRCKMTFEIPSRGLIGFHYQFLMLTSGQGIMSHVFIEYRPYLDSLKISGRLQGAMISMCAGEATGYSLFNLQERGHMLVEPQAKVYEGMLVGIHSRNNDLVVNVTKGKQLTNMRASGTDENIILTPPKRMTLEIALETINDDELVEITPLSIRLRKKYLTEVERKRSGKE
jgi:GTP-binding protein